MKLPFPDPKFELLVLPAPAEIPCAFAFEPSLFNTPAYLALPGAEALEVFYLLRKSNQTIAAILQVHAQGEKAVSPFRASFGSVEFAETLEVVVLAEFMAQVRQFLISKGIREISLTGYPFCYAPAQSALLTQVLLQQGYVPEMALLNYHVPVSEAAFITLLHPSARRRLQKCHKHNFTFQPEPPEFLAEAYRFIATCRHEKGRRLSLTLPQLALLFTRFPDRYLLFSVRNGPEPAAVTVAVKTRADVLLTFYPASPQAYNAFSPAIMLNEGLYQYCQTQQLNILDLGISGTKTDPHYSLLQFKARLGGQPSLKLTLAYRV